MGEINAASVTLQAALFSILSTAIAQIIAVWQEEGVAFRLFPYLTFTSITVVTTPPNYFYQKWLEDAFPARIPESACREPKSSNERRSDQLSKSNTITKFLFDQTFAAAANTLAFIALTTLSNGGNLQQVGDDIQSNFLTLLFAGWRFWPLVTLTNLCVVPWEWRPAVGNTAGLCWGIFLNIREVAN